MEVPPSEVAFISLHATLGGTMFLVDLSFEAV